MVYNAPNLTWIGLSSIRRDNTLLLPTTIATILHLRRNRNTLLLPPWLLFTNTKGKILISCLHHHQAILQTRMDNPESSTRLQHRANEQQLPVAIVAGGRYVGEDLSRSSAIRANDTRQIRCSGFESSSDGRCTNCVRFNQECMFTPVSSQAQAFVPAHAAYPHLRNAGPGPRGGPPMTLYGAHGQPLPPHQQQQGESTLPPPQGMYPHYGGAPLASSMPDPVRQSFHEPIVKTRT